jgi:DNA-directed RNA polymerase subunit E'/Rpb7
MKLVSPYRNIKQYTRISVEPYHMNSDIKNNMKNILKKKVEKKCNKNGFVDEVYRILEYSDGMMPAENLNGSAIYNITYHCKICIPIENTVIIGQVRVINQELVVAINGPIMFFIPKDNVDTNIWDIPDGYMNKTKKRKLMANDFIKIQVVDKRINQNDSQIKAIGKLLDFATPEEVDKYFGSKIVTERIVDGTKVAVAVDEPEQIETVNTEESESNFII